MVVSTAYRPSPSVRQRCEWSVSSQSVKARHIYLEDETGGRHLENLHAAVHALDPADVVLSVDGDDWLLDPQAIELVRHAYAQGAWMTWGQYATFENGKRVRAGHAHDHQRRRACRFQPWYASHLKTFRAGLFQQIQKESLLRGGTWLQQCCDMAFMFPLLEMTDDRGSFIKKPIYAYDYTVRRTRKVDVRGTALYTEQTACERYVRGLPSYARLEAAPW